jgi:multiple sugar transport system ATP-binding protein
MAEIRFTDVTKVFPDGTVAVDRLTLWIEDGEFLVLVGPSGSGKSTALRMAAGLEEISGGDIHIGDRLVNDLEPRRRDVAMVFQNYALYPHMDVERNLSFSLRVRHVAKPTMRERVAETAGMLAIREFLHKRPRELSGGQRQRVAMGRAIVREPKAFLMDEPLSNLDAKLRVETRAYIARLHQRLGTTTLYVTHDQTEAMTMGDRVAVMRDGRLEQVDEPRRLYAEPANAFVAGFIGSPAMNLVRSRLEAENGDVVASLGRERLVVPEAVLRARRGLGRFVGTEVVLGIRPEDIEDAAFAPPGAAAPFEVGVSLAEPLGSEVIAHLDVDSPGEPLGVVARLNPRSRADTGDRLLVAVDGERLHFFDAETHAAIR